MIATKAPAFLIPDLAPLRAGGGSSLRVFGLLMAYLAAVKLLLTYIPQVFRSTSQAAVFDWKLIAVWTAAGMIGVALGRRTGFPRAWDGPKPWRTRVVTPTIIGVVFGIAAIMTDAATHWSARVAQEMGLSSIHIDWPASLIVYPGGAVIVEIVYRLATIPLLMWFVSNGVLRGRGQSVVFWILALATSAIEPYGDLSLQKFGTFVMLPVLVQDYALNLAQAWIFRRSGFLASIVMRSSFYLVWHVLWGLGR